LRSLLRAPARTARFVCFVVLLASAGAVAHGVGHRVDRAEAVVVRFSSQHEPAMADVGYRVFSPGGRILFAQGRTDALGRAVFIPDSPGTWRVLMATDDGHGAEVEIAVDAGQVARVERAGAVRIGGMDRLTATAAGVGYVLGLGGLLALWRRRSAR
jgi:nickel transport protein